MTYSKRFSGEDDRTIETIETEILILGSGGAGLYAALCAYDNNPRLRIVLVGRGLLGKGGCSRLVQGGLNVVLNENDSIDMHFKDTLKGGAFINDQEMVWTLVNDAPKVVHELEVKYGLFLDRGKDGNIHQKPFAGQSFDRTVHVADLTGIQIMGRLADQIHSRDITVTEETRALDLLTTDNGSRVIGAVLLNVRTGEIFIVNSKVTIVATGGAASMYKVFATSTDKSGDGVAMCFRAGVKFVDMEMLQFHPTGLLVADSHLTGVILEEGLRGAGARLYNGLGERFMERYDPQNMERATRDVVSRAGYLEILAGRGTAEGGVLLDPSHLGAKFVEENFPGMCERVRDMGQDLAREGAVVSPSAHYMMGGAKIDIYCQTNLQGLLVAGEDAGGTHGANRLGGNGICDSLVFGRRAGDTAAKLAVQQKLRPYQQAQAEETKERWLRPFYIDSNEGIYTVRDELKNLTWQDIGLVRNGKQLKRAIKRLDELMELTEHIGLANKSLKRYNMEWNDIINVTNWITVARMLAKSALYRKESRGAHYREDFPDRDDKNWLCNIYLRKMNGSDIEISSKPVEFTRKDLNEV
ncbi:FAD-binding protein [Chloroflexota bacterium]